MRWRMARPSVAEHRVSSFGKTGTVVPGVWLWMCGLSAISAPHMLLRRDLYTIGGAPSHGASSRPLPSRAPDAWRTRRTTGSWPEKAVSFMAVHLRRDPNRKPPADRSCLVEVAAERVSSRSGHAASAIRILAVHDSYNLDSSQVESVGDKNAPVADTEPPFIGASPQAFDVAESGARVPFDGVNDAGARRPIQLLQIPEGTTRERDAPGQRSSSRFTSSRV